MTDRELLELAAKAAGYDIDFESPVNGFYVNGYDENGDPAAWWNPLTDDGDALRLVVKLGLALAVGNVNDYIAVQSDRLPEVIHSDKTDDPYAAARRAIVRAAAEIGKEGNE